MPHISDSLGTLTLAGMKWELHISDSGEAAQAGTTTKSRSPEARAPQLVKRDRSGNSLKNMLVAITARFSVIIGQLVSLLATTQPFIRVLVLRRLAR